MKTCMKLLLLSLTLTVVCGCRSRIEVEGEYYSMLTDRETRELLILARETLLRNASKLVLPEEVSALRRMEPELKIDYRGDCSGEAVVIWDLPKRKYEVVIDGQLNETSPFKRNVMVRIMKKQGEVLDFRNRRPAESALPPPRP